MILGRTWPCLLTFSWLCVLTNIWFKDGKWLSSSHRKWGRRCDEAGLDQLLRPWLAQIAAPVEMFGVGPTFRARGQSSSCMVVAGQSRPWKSLRPLHKGINTMLPGITLSSCTKIVCVYLLIMSISICSELLYNMEIVQLVLYQQPSRKTSMKGAYCERHAQFVELGATTKHPEKSDVESKNLRTRSTVLYWGYTL